MAKMCGVVLLLRGFHMFLLRAKHFFNTSQHFFCACMGIIAQSGRPRRQVLWHKPKVFHGFKNAALHQVVVREAGFGAAEAGVVGAGFT